MLKRRTEVFCRLHHGDLKLHVIFIAEPGAMTAGVYPADLYNKVAKIIRADRA